MANRANKKINLFFWNSHSIRGKIDETFDYLIDNNIDIGIFTETWLKPIDVLYCTILNLNVIEMIEFLELVEVLQLLSEGILIILYSLSI